MDMLGMPCRTKFDDWLEIRIATQQKRFGEVPELF
jgi:hypothetical protein